MHRVALLLSYVDFLPCCSWKFFQFLWFSCGLINMVTFLLMLLAILVCVPSAVIIKWEMQWL